MKILLFYISARIRVYPFPLGISAIAGYLEKYGIPVDFVYYTGNRDYAYAMDKITASAPDIIGFSGMSSTAGIVYQLSKDIKERFPKIFQIYGGIHPTLNPECLEEAKSLDAVCVGYGEFPLRKLIEQLEKKEEILDIPGLWLRRFSDGKEEIVKNNPYFPAGNFDDFISYNHKIILDELSRFTNFQAERLDIIFNRGCPFNCAFCCNAKINELYPNHTFAPSPEASIRSLKETLRDNAFKEILIHDDNFTLNKRWLREFLRLYTQEINLPFGCNLRVGCFDETDAALLSKANISYGWIGIESGNEYIRNKILKKGISNAQIIKAVGLLHNYNIGVFTQNMIGLPYETPRHFLDTIRINALCEPVIFKTIYCFFPYPKTELYDLCLKEKLVSDEYENIRENTIERTQPVLSSKYFPKKKVIFYRKNFELLVRYQYFRNSKPYIFFMPLTESTSALIAAIMKIFIYIRYSIFRLRRL